MTIAKHSSMFAVPEAALDELCVLHDAWSRALDELKENSRALENRLYDRAAEVAVYAKTLTGPEHYSAFAEIAQLFFEELWPRRQRKVFTAAEVVHYRAALAELERRRGGEDGIVASADPLNTNVTDDHVRAVYRMFLDVFHTAAQRGLGFTWAVRHDGAEDALAAAIRDRQERDRRHAERMRGLPKPTLDDARRDLAETRRRMEAKYGPPPDRYEYDQLERAMAELLAARRRRRRDD